MGLWCHVHSLSLNKHRHGKRGKGLVTSASRTGLLSAPLVPKCCIKMSEALGIDLCAGKGGHGLLPHPRVVPGASVSTDQQPAGSLPRSLLLACPKQQHAGPGQSLCAGKFGLRAPRDVIWLLCGAWGLPCPATQPCLTSWRSLPLLSLNPWGKLRLCQRLQLPQLFTACHSCVLQVPEAVVGLSPAFPLVWCRCWLCRSPLLVPWPRWGCSTQLPCSGLGSILACFNGSLLNRG